MMKGTIDRGTSYAVHTLADPLAGKTGTTNRYTDAWFIGFSPEYTVGVWAGYDDPAKSLGGGATGAEVTLPIWIDIFKQFEEKKLRVGKKDFEPPPGVVIVPMDLPSGRRGATARAYTLGVPAIARNVLGIFAALVAGYVALAVAASVDYALAYQRTYTTDLGEMLLRLTALWPHLAFAVVLGLVAALIVSRPQRRRWLVVVGVLAVAECVLSVRYIAPEWQEWTKTIVEMSFVGSAAACTFWLVSCTRNRQAVPRQLIEGR